MMRYEIVFINEGDIVWRKKERTIDYPFISGKKNPRKRIAKFHDKYEWDKYNESRKDYTESHMS